MDEERTVRGWFEPWWDAYVEIAPHAEPARALLRPSGGILGMDHIAVRTFATPRLGMRRLAPRLEAAGYQQTGSYEFGEKRLRAVSYSHRSAPLPRIFISELVLSAFTREFRELVSRCDSRQEHDAPDLLWNPECPWRTLSSTEYATLRAESEYGAWVGAYGLRVNHFTIGFQQLSGFESLEEVNDHLLASGFELNGGTQPIQGSKERLLEQSSTVAELVDLKFSDGKVERVRSCYVEFARRYRDNMGNLFDRFVTSQADTIFESTDMNRSVDPG